MGFHWLPSSCSRVAATVMSEASVVKAKGADRGMNAVAVTAAMLSLQSAKASNAVGIGLLDVL